MGDALEFLRRHRAAPGAREKLREQIPRALLRRFALGGRRPAAHERGAGVERALDLQPLDEEQGRRVCGGIAHQRHGHAFDAAQWRQFGFDDLGVLFVARGDLDDLQDAAFLHLHDFFGFEFGEAGVGLGLFDVGPGGEEGDFHRTATGGFGIHSGAEQVAPRGVEFERRVDRPGFDVRFARSENSPVAAHRRARRARLAVARGHGADVGLARAERDGELRDVLRGIEIALHEHGRHAEHVTDVVEAVADVVGREIGGGLRIHADEIADGVVVLGTIEAAQRDAAGVGRRVAVVVGEDGARGREKRAALGVGGLGLVVGRHVAGLHGLENVLPFLAVLEQRGVVAKFVQGEIGLLLFLAVARGAVLFEKGDARFSKRFLRRGGEGQQGEDEKRADQERHRGNKPPWCGNFAGNSYPHPRFRGKPGVE
jgi:hypothetical protein